MLVLLRVAIGWHFYSEGIDKHRAGNWDASPFFANARGPFAEDYRQLVWDSDGKLRLGKLVVEQTAEEKKAGKKPTPQYLLWLATYRDRVSEHYGFDDAQKKKANDNFVAAVTNHKRVLEDNATDLEEYNLGVKRMADLDQDPSRDGVSSLRGQRDTIRREWLQKLRPTLSQIDQVWSNYENAQNSLATAEQKKEHPPLRMGKPRLAAMDTNIINAVMPYFDIAIGLCLLLGLFTPLAALAAAVFLGSVFLSQYPPTTGPSSSNYQLIESMACLVLAGTGAGRFAGLDYFLHLIVRKNCGNPTDENE